MGGRLRTGFKGFIRNLCIISWLVTAAIFLYICLPWRIPDCSKDGFGDKKLLVKYENIGCGSTRVKVLEGVEGLASLFRDTNPDIGFDEIVFSEDSDEPLKHIDSAMFYTGGLKERYSYIIYGEVIGITAGAPDCCDPKPAYYERVPLYRVKEWRPTVYVSGWTNPFLNSGTFLTWFAFWISVVISVLLTVYHVLRGMLNYYKRRRG